MPFTQGIETAAPYDMSNMNKNKLRHLGFELGEQATGGRSQGAWFATAYNGTPVVLKWTAGEAMIDRYTELVPKLDELRLKGIPVPEYLHISSFNDGTLSAQQLLSGQSEDNPSPAAVTEMVGLLATKTGITWSPTEDGKPTWGKSVARTLKSDQEGCTMHKRLRVLGPQGEKVLERIQAVGADAHPSIFPENGLVHFDLHTDNILVEKGRISGIIDWEEACSGDPQYDLVQFAFDLDGHDQPVWNFVETSGIDPQVLRAYIALLVLKCTSSAISDHPEDVPRQLNRAERVFTRYGV